MDMCAICHWLGEQRGVATGIVWLHHALDSHECRYVYLCNICKSDGFTDQYAAHAGDCKVCAERYADQCEINKARWGD